MSIEAYEVNLSKRLEELRQGDRAYSNHTQLCLQAIVYAGQLHGENGSQRVLDCGCGLGFMTAEIAKFCEATGIDPSDKSIALAKKEHPDVIFYNASAESFPKKMSELGIPPFDQVILNMVLHSVDNKTALNILRGVKKCLKTEGTVILVVPTKDWLVQKLIEYAQDQEMEKESGLVWVGTMLKKRKVNLPVKIRGGSYYPEPLTIYNRTTKDYEKLLKTARFGFKWNGYDLETGELISSENLTYLDMNDYFISQELYARNRLLMMSFSLREAPQEVVLG